MKNYFWIGVVEDRMDPLYLGRCRVRIFGVHTSDNIELPTEDLPWAVSVTPASSASMNGVGSAPVGPVEGTTVVGFFLDHPDTQLPAFVGSIAGIPQADNSPDSPNSISIEYDKIDTEPSYIDPLKPEEFVPDESDFDALSPYQLKCDENGIELIKAQTTLYLKAHWDGAQWILGYSQAIINGKAVKQGQTINDIEAEDNLRSFITNTIESGVRDKVKVDVTQSMFNSLCVLEYKNEGAAAYELVNQRKFDDAKDVMLATSDFDVVQMFIKDGVPKPDGSSSTSLANHVGEQQQVSSVIRGRNLEPAPVFTNFGVPPAAWPRLLHLNEPDTNRLARGHNIRRTIVYTKEQELEEGIKMSNVDTLVWKHPPVPYNAQYPFNRVIETESGHVIEIDDTPGCERINVHHKAGTFIEIDANGTRVARTKGDVYEIMERNGFVHVKGHVVVNVESSANIQVAGNADVHVGENLYATVGNDVKLHASGNMDMVVDNDFQMNAKSIKMRAETGIDFQISGGNFQVDGQQVWLNSGKSVATNITTIKDHRTDLEQLELELRPLDIQTRVSEDMTLVEFPEEDSSASQHRQDMVKRGVLTPTDLAETPIVKGEEVGGGQGPTAVLEPVLTDPRNVPTYQLSKYYNLGALTQSTTIGNKQKPVLPMHGLKVEQIIQNLSRLATNCLDPLYEVFKFTIVSGLRHPSNRYSKPNVISRHEIGLAADLVMTGKSKREVIQICRQITTMIPYDTIMLEYSPRGNYWIHIQLTDGPFRRRNMTAKQTGSRTQIVSSTSFVVV